MPYCESPAVKNVLACSKRDGETVEGRFDERLAPDAVMARLMSGTASSMRAKSLRIANIICFNSRSC